VRILVVEDDFLAALEIETRVRHQGCEVVGPVATVESAVAAVQAAELDGALLDFQLRDGTSEPVAELLQARGCPFCFLSGYGQLPELSRFADSPRLSKPVDAEALRRAIDGFQLGRSSA
jgi:DNA-binding NarL/FixJ family response regulator